jgi:hypothetical protein
LLFLLLLFFLPSVAGSAGVAVGTVTGISGRAVRQAGQETVHPFKQGDSILIADTIETGSDSRLQILLTDGSVIVLSPGSKIRISQYSYDTTVNRRTCVVNLKQGILHITMNDPRISGSHIAIETEQALTVAAVANFIVETGAEKTVAASLAGNLSVRNSTNVVIGTVSVGENMSTVVKTKEPPTVPSILSQQQRRRYSKDARFF